MDPKKRPSDTLRQRDKARQEFLELKKMQAGELDPGPKPSEIALKPHTLKEKKDNFLYHYKYLTIGLLFAAVALTILIWQMVTRTNYDGTLVVYCYENLAQIHTDKMGEYMEGYYPDFTGNGLVELAVADCAYEPNTSDYTIKSAKATKLQTTLMVEKNALLFILDAETVAYLNGLSEEIDLFEPDDLIELPDDFYEAVGIEKGDHPLYLGLRSIENTTLEGSAAERYEQVKEMFEKFPQK